jgi:chromosome segregation ATPase
MIELNHGQRQTFLLYWRADRIEWLERQCSLALAAGHSPMRETRQDRKALKREAVKLDKRIDAALNQLEALEKSAGQAADVLATCKARAVDLRKSLRQARDFSWQLQGDLERLGADRKPEERTTLLIRQIASALHQDGIPLTDVETGALFQIAGLALDAVGAEPKDLRGTIRQVLARPHRG